MPSTLYEIAELPNGDVVLRRIDDEAGEPLVRLCFSTESLAFMGDAKFEVAKAMIEAGMEAATELAEQDHLEDFSEGFAEFEKPVLH